MAEVPYSKSPFAKLLAAQRSASTTSKQKQKTGSPEPASHVRHLLQQGIALQQKGDIGLAAEVYQRVLGSHPNHPDALHLLGTVAVSARQIQSAVDLFRRAVAGKPSDPAIHFNLANALLEQDDPATAEVHIRKALKLHPDLHAAQALLAECRAAAGATQEARELYADALAHSPDNPRAIMGHANLCMAMGEVETAKTIYRRALTVRLTAPRALARLAACERLAKDSPEATLIAQLLGQPGLGPVDRLNLSFAAGRIAEAAGDYDEAFVRFSDAKRAGAGSFDMAGHRQELKTAKLLFTKPFFEARARHGRTSARPVFVVGMPRSGTTLVEQIISRHPDAAVGGELRDIGRIATSLGFGGDDPRDFAKRLRRLAGSDAGTLADSYLAELDRISASARRVTDKNPGNFKRLGLIALLFPNARVIHCRRDPLDTCLSCFTSPLNAQTHGYATDLATLGAYYREYIALMDHWRDVLPLRIHELDYERLIDSPEEQSRKLIDFMGLPWDPACLAPHESTRPVHTISMTQVREPIYKTSVGRWRNYESHLGPLKAALGDRVETARDQRAANWNSLE